MRAISRHLTRCVIGGIVALLPVGGTVLTIVYLESALSGSWLAEQAFYFPGMGLLLAVLVVYLIGLAVTTFLGRWLWTRVDRLLDRLPALGQLYQTLKQILGYGDGKGALFERVVLVRSRELDGFELGLVTREDGPANAERLTVFLPGAPNPAAGRLVMIDPRSTEPLDVPVSDALRTLVSVGKTPLAPAASPGDGARSR